MPAVLVTGANRGIGLEFARQYAEAGWDVIACCRNPRKADKLQALAQKNKSVRVEALDAEDLTGIRKLAARLKNVPIDVLINNAGILSGANSRLSASDEDKSQALGSIDAAAWLRVVRVNVLGPLKIAEAFVPHVAASRQRKIVMISSGWGSIEKMDGGHYAYRPSKAMLNAVTANLAADLKEKKISVAAISPGWVRTDMGGKDADIAPAASVGAVRETIAGLTLKDSGRFMNRKGETYPW